MLKMLRDHQIVINPVENRKIMNTPMHYNSVKVRISLDMLPFFLDYTLNHKHQPLSLLEIDILKYKIPILMPK